MPSFRPAILPRVLTLLAGLVILKVTASIVLNYRHYVPPDFESDFLSGREAYFFGSYQWAFYAHLAAGPPALLLGPLLLSERFRRRWPRWHRRLGRVQGLCVLCLVAPSGLWMAWRADAGPVAGLGFASLAVATATCVALGWRAAVRRQFAVHRRWMWRCYVLLCSTVLLRVLAGLSIVADLPGNWFDAVNAWASWLLPLAALELVEFVRQNSPTRSPPFTENSARRISADSSPDRNRTLPSASTAFTPPV